MFVLSSKISETQIPFFQKDGLVDIFIGLWIFFAGSFLWTEMVWMVGVFIPAFLPSFQFLRKRIVEPRIAKFIPNANQNKINQNIFLYVSLIIGIFALAGFCIFFVFEFHSWSGIAVLRQYILLLLGMIFSCLWIFAGAMLNIRRYFLYAALTLGVMMVGQFANVPFWITCVILGAMITFLGMLVLLKFLKQHPNR